MVQRLDDRAAPPARGPASSIPSGDRPTPIVDISREVEATIGDTRETSRLRISQLGRLVDLTREEAPAEDATAASRENTPQASPSVPLRPPPARPPSPPPVALARRPSLPLVIGATLLAGAVAFAYARTHPAPAPPASLSTVIAPTIADTVAPPAAPSGPPTPSAAEAQAREALQRLRIGLDTCIRDGIHALPGSSPAVPPSLGALKDGAYTPAPADWKTSVWSCAQFQVTEPMQFQVQWQLVTPNIEGMALAWIDEDRDGVADRALAFSIRLGPKGAPILGETNQVAAAWPVSTGRR